MNSNRRPFLRPAHPGAENDVRSAAGERSRTAYRALGPAGDASSVGPFLERIKNKIFAVGEDVLVAAALADFADQIERLQAIGLRLLELGAATTAEQLSGLAEIDGELDRIRELSRLAIEKTAGPADTMH